MVHGLFLFVIVSYLLVRVLGRDGDPLLRRLWLTIRFRGKRLACGRLRGSCVSETSGQQPGSGSPSGLLILVELFLLVPGLVGFTRASEGALDAEAHTYRGLSALALGLPIALLGLLVLFRPRLQPSSGYGPIWFCWVWP